jgi:hypothetical protein
MIPHFGRDGQKKYIETSLSQFKQELDILLKAVDSIGTVLLVGGEPFLHSELPEIVAYAAGKEKVGLVDVVTNCTIIPSRELIDAARAYGEKVFFGLSNYSSNPALTSMLKRSEIIYILKENGIKHTLDTGDAQWFRYDLQECAYSEEQMQKVFTACQWHHCLYILDGILTICPRSLVGEKLKAFKLYDNEKILLAQQNYRQCRSALLSFYEKSGISACRYCLKYPTPIMPAIQL